MKLRKPFIQDTSQDNEHVIGAYWIEYWSQSTDNMEGRIRFINRNGREFGEIRFYKDGSLLENNIPEDIKKKQLMILRYYKSSFNDILNILFHEDDLFLTINVNKVGGLMSCTWQPMPSRTNL
jgi:hypothetical protein